MEEAHHPAAPDPAANETHFAAAEQATLAAIDQAEAVADDRTITDRLRELITLYARRAEYLTTEQRTLWRRQMRDDERQSVSPDDFRRRLRERQEHDGDAGRERAWAIAAIRRKQLACWNRLLECQEREVGALHPDLIDTLLSIAALHSAHFNEFHAFPTLRRALAIREQTLGAEHPETLALVRRLAGGHSTLCDFAAAAPLWQRLLTHAEHAYAADPTGALADLRSILGELGQAYNALTSSAAAEQTWRRLLALLAPPAYPFDWPYQFPTAAEHTQLYGYYGVGRACAAQGNWRAAEESLRAALALHERYPEFSLSEHGGARNFDLGHGLHAYAATLRQLGRQGEALPLFARALTLRKDRYPDRRFALQLRDYAVTLRDLNRTDEARLLERRAKSIEAAIAAQRSARRRAART